MKKIIRLVVMMTMLVFLPLTAAKAQTRLNITIINATSSNSNTPVMATVGQFNVGPLGAGEQSTTPFSLFTLGDIPIVVHVCDGVQKGFLANWPPDWSMDTGNFPNVALTRDYLTSHPTTNDVKAHIDGINRILKDFPGAKIKGKELKEWFDLIKRMGITTEVMNCPNLTIMPSMVSNWGVYTYYGGSKTIILTVVGNRATGFHVENPARWVN